jgi:hypothetical protein
MLRHNVISLEEQTDQDFERLYITDDIGRGLHWANQQFYRYRYEVSGDYVLMLDDDDMLTRRDTVAMLKEAAKDDPDLIMCRFDCGKWGILPTDEVWQYKYPKLTHVCTPSFITRRDIWYENIESFGQPTAGDYSFLSAIWPSLKRVVWLDVVIGKTQRNSKGAPELA